MDIKEAEESFLSFLLKFFLDDLELHQLCDLSKLSGAFEEAIRNGDKTQGITIKRPSSWAEMLLIAADMPVENAFSQLLHCIRECAPNSEQVLQLLHLSSQRDLSRLHRLQFAAEKALPLALCNELFCLALTDFAEFNVPNKGDANKTICRLIQERPDDWFELLVMAAISAANEEEVVELLTVIAPFIDACGPKVTSLQQQLDNVKSDEKFHAAQSAVSRYSNDWFDRNAIEFEPETHRFTNHQLPAQLPSNVGLLSNDRQLRDYQLELAEPALAGRNSIVIAPTGSGKTLVAVYVTLQVLEKEPDAKVAFLASTSQLVQQQYEEFRAHLPARWCNKICKIHGGSDTKDRLPFAQAIKRHSVLVLSTQILVNALNREIESFGGRELAAFRLLIFDECHNCQGGHPSSEVMLHYFRLRRDLSETGQPGIKLPQILGLTASPGTGRASRPEQANDHLIRLCANLDSPYPVTVQRCKASLDLVTSNPDCEIHIVPGNPGSEKFARLLKGLMRRGEALLRDFIDALPQGQGEGLPTASPPPRGVPNYINFCTDIEYNVHKVADESARKNLLACSRYLRTYNETLMIGQYFRSIDALHYLEKALRAPDEIAKQPASRAENILRESLDEFMGPLITYCDTNEAKDSSPPLGELVKILKKQFCRPAGQNGRTKSRAIVFVQQKFYARVLADYLNEPGTMPDSSFAATYVTGATSSEAAGGTNVAEQRARLKDFKDGRFNVIACTSVTEEGLDIPDCNLVVRYCHLTNEISMVQSKGRGRAKDSEYHVIVAETQEWLREKERTNQQRDEMMKRAVMDVTGMQPKDLEVKMLEYQAHLLDREDDDGAVGGGGRPADSDHDILCGKCQDFLTHSTKLKLIGDIHRIVLDATMFISRLRGQQGGEVKKVPGMEQIGVDLLCENCGIKVAKVVRHGKLYFPLLSVENVSFRRSGTQEVERKARKWKQTEEFLRPVAKLTNDDKSNWRRQVPGLPEHLRL